MEPKITLELTKAEAQALVNCLDIATKAGGLQNARVALPIAEKIMIAAEALQPAENAVE